MKANFGRLIEGASKATEYSMQRVRKPQLALLISCIGRKLILKQRIEEELQAVSDFVGEECKMTGFYSYGEIGPSGRDTLDSQLHNQTMTVTLLSEKV